MHLFELALLPHITAPIGASDGLFGLERRTRALFTWPAGRFSRLRFAAPFPILAIDQVYAGSDWKTVAVRRGPELGSDHYPVVVELARP